MLAAPKPDATASERRVVRTWDWRPVTVVFCLAADVGELVHFLGPPRCWCHDGGEGRPPSGGCRMGMRRW